jgi:phage shock protein C
MSTADELQKLQQLRQSGAISDEEYAKAKADLLNAPPGGSGSPVVPVDVERQTRL